ncbi:MAG: hypothetical protein RMJ32_05530, partial [Aquificaceae bacterium]|nr:hypothetical protein [Aquificaceae bacterium]
MSTNCLLLDKRKTMTSLLADIFAVTGHNLLAAFDEKMGIDLSKKGDPEIIILPLEDLNFWIELIKSEIYTLPIFLVETYEEGEGILNFGLGQDNFEVLPFNPMELLTKVHSLTKNYVNPKELAEIGVLNLIIRFLKKNTSAYVKTVSKEGVCTVYVSGGRVLSSDSSPDVIKKVLSTQEEVYMQQPHDNMPNKLAHEFKTNWDFFSSLFEAPALAEVKTEESTIQQQHLTEQVAVIDLNEPVLISENIYWIGLADDTSVYQKNSYLCIFHKDETRVPLMVNPPSLVGYMHIKPKIEKVIGDISNLRALVVFGIEPEEYGGIIKLLQANNRMFVITSLTLATKLWSLGIPMGRIRPIESFPSGRLKLATGHSVDFEKVDFAPSPGSFYMYDPSSMSVFTGRFMSSLTIANELNPTVNTKFEHLELYTGLSMPSYDALKTAITKIERLKPRAIYPLHGNPITSEIGEILERLKLTRLSTGSLTVEESVAIDVVSGILKTARVIVNSEEMENVVNFLSQFAFFEGESVVESFVDPKTLPGLAIYALHFAKVKPEAIREAY